MVVVVVVASRLVRSLWQLDSALSLVKGRPHDWAASFRLPAGIHPSCRQDSVADASGRSFEGCEALKLNCPW